MRGGRTRRWGDLPTKAEKIGGFDWIRPWSGCDGESQSEHVCENRRRADESVFFQSVLFKNLFKYSQILHVWYIYLHWGDLRSM